MLIKSGCKGAQMMVEWAEMFILMYCPGDQKDMQIFLL